MRQLFPVALAAALMSAPAMAQEMTTTELLDKINNPVADLDMLPLENNFLFRNGTTSYVMNAQPVIPFSLNEDWLVISRTIIPVMIPEFDNGDQVFGLGDTEATFFLSPKRVNKGDLVWGAGPVIVLPTATRPELGESEWAAGLSFVALKQSGGWHTGILTNYITSFDGGDDPVNTGLIDPWVARTFDNGFGWKLETEAEYNFANGKWTVPLEAGVSQLFTTNNQPINIGADVLYYAERTPDDPQWGVRVTMNFIFPNK